ncbi:hypothetical protein JW960_05165 [candidate division KSB1 bacterium]|nr:hypothetical protein [candidate division KSB1 bacterium]
MTKKIIPSCMSFLIVFLVASTSPALEFHGAASNSVYSLEDTTTHTRLFQYLRFSVDAPWVNKLKLNISLRALTDMNESLDSEDRFKAYTLNLTYSNLFNRMNIVLGRQFLHPGTILGGLDGLYADYAFSSNMKIAAYTGTEAHFMRSLKIYELEDSFVAGGFVELKHVYKSRFQALYLQKANKDDIFWQITGLNIENALVPKTNLQLQAHYDLQNSRLHRLLITARHQLSQKLAFSVGMKNQYPQVYANSFFTIFDIDAYKQYNAACSYNILNDYFVQGQFQYIQFDDENATRTYVTLNNANGSIGVLYESGYAGEQLSAVLDYAYSVTPTLLASISLDYSKYKTETIYEFESQIANAARLSYRFMQNWSVDVEYQWLTNRFKESDSRFLNHIRYRW